MAHGGILVLVHLLRIRVSGPSLNQELEVALKPSKLFTVGRKDCDLNLDDIKISRRHISLSVEGGVPILDDLGSHNGTFFDETRITTRDLQEGDCFRLGSHSIEILSIRKEGSKSRQATGDIAHPDDENVARSEFLFYRARQLNFADIKSTYLFAFKNWRGFWQTVSYDVPIDRSLPVLVTLALTSSLFGALIGRGSWAIFAALSVAVTFVGLVIVGAAVMGQLRRWFQAEGDFEQYVAFSVYWVFLYLPFQILSMFLGRAAGMVGLVFWAWGTWGFIKAFRPNVIRFLILMIAVALALLAISAAILFLLYSLFTRAGVPTS
jgi:hypothetical protein